MKEMYTFPRDIHEDEGTREHQWGGQAFNRRTLKGRLCLRVVPDPR